MADYLRIENLKKYFKTAKGTVHAVDDVSFSIERGKTLGVVGESGCGKSTFLKTLDRMNDLIPGVRIEGEVKYNGQDIFQDPFSSLNPRMTVADSILEPMEIHHMYDGDKDRQREEVARIMDTVGLARRLADSYPHELDGGRRQRVGIARALALQPDFIVCDEPVSALDVSIQAQILNLMQDLQEQSGLTYIFITHDLSVVKHISDEICVMYLGNLVEKCPSDKLFEKQLHPYSQALLSAIPVAKTDAVRNRIILKGEISSPIDPAPGCRFASRCLYAKPECFKTQPEFKEVEPEHFVACHLFD